jgi:hypothetical protein
MNFLSDVHDRGVLKFATAYLEASWLVIEVGHAPLNVFDLPHLPLQPVVILLVLASSS